MSMEEFLNQETERLVRSWRHHEASHLGSYLTAGVEDPRVNVQSILTRHHLLTVLFASRFEGLMNQELRFAAAMNWLGNHGGELDAPEARAAFLHALRRGADNAEGMGVPAFLLRLFAELPTDTGGLHVPNYVEEFLAGEAQPEALDTFQMLWTNALRAESPQRVRVLEAACGSANDYRCLASYGIAHLLDYTGFDLCETNVQNARTLFPAARFEVGNVFDITAADGAYDLSFAHDLFEHLSPEALPVGIRELCRVTRRGLCVGFFQMAEVPDHIVRPVDDYHWNTLSLERTRALFGEQGFDVQALHIGTYLHARTGCAETHNPNAYTFIASRR